MRESKLLECKELGTRRCFPEVSESRHSPLVLVGAPAQGCSSPLIRARIKCSLRADSLTLCRGESPTTAHKMSWVIHKLRRMITKLPITTKPSRWMHTCYSLYTNEVLNLGFSNHNLLTRLLHSLAHERCFSAEQMSKRAQMDE
jgi:hypothetical protein